MRRAAAGQRARGARLRYLATDPRREQLVGAVAGAGLVLRLQLLRLWRNRGHRIAILAWVASTYLLVGLGWAATGGSAGVLLGLATFGALTVALCVAPLICATGIGSDRDLGVLPFLQSSGLRAGGLAAGAWGTGFVVPMGVLVATLPALLTAAVLDGAGMAPLGQSLLALGAGVSAAASLSVAVATGVRRSVWAICLAFVIVAMLTVGTLVAYAMASSATSETVRLPVRVSASSLASDASQRAGQPAGTVPSPDADGCVVVTQDVTRYRPDRVWGLLALNPFVVLADALTGPGDMTAAEGKPSITPVQALSASIRSIKVPPSAETVENCPRHVAAPGARSTSTPLWPAGLGILTALSVAGWWLSSRNLRAPADVVGRRWRRRR